MTRRKLRAITVEGFTSIRSATVQLGDLNVLIGANGAGKSNFIRALRMLGWIVNGELGLSVGRAGGASALRSVGLPATAPISLRVKFDEAGYLAELVPAAGDAFVFSCETAWGLDGEPGQPLARGYRETMLPNPDAPWWPSAQLIIEAIRDFRVYHFHNTSDDAAVKKNANLADNEVLHEDAGNIAAVLRRLRNSDHASYRRIVGAIQHVAPFFKDFVLEPELSREHLRLRWQQTGSDTVFAPDAFSDGTLRFICLTTLLTQPDLPSLVVLDEPELGLHPFAIVQFAEMLRAASRRTQVLIATQSVTLINQFELDGLIIVERRDGASVFERPDPDRLRDWLAEYSLGELWEKNMLGGRPRPERG